MQMVIWSEVDEQLEAIKKSCELGRKTAARRLLSSKKISPGDTISYPDGGDDVEFRVEAVLSDGEILLVDETNNKDSFALFLTEGV